MSATAPAATLTPTGAALLAGIAGFVDTATFVALHGVFAAHVTGNFVLVGASLVLGTGGVLAKLLTFPVFLIGVAATRIVARRWDAPVKPLLTIQAVLLAAFWIGLVLLGPFADPDDPGLILVAALAVLGMAVQNATMRIAFPTATPTTMMTGNTTGIMMDLADWMTGRLVPDGAARLRRVGQVLLGFAAGCALGAAVLTFIGPIGLVVPVLALAFMIARRA